jgi:hypothetical protein
MYPIPMRHGLTIGEIARLFNEHFGIGADLEVIAMEGWRREMYWDDTGLTWIISSPNIPTFDTTTVYPGGVLFEGTNVSEGRGTTRPFELLGAPWVVAERFAEAMNRAICRRLLSSRGLRADVPQARAEAVRRRAAARARSADVPPGETARAHRSVSRCRSHSLERSAVRYEYEKMPIDCLADRDAARTDRRGVTAPPRCGVVEALIERSTARAQVCCMLRMTHDQQNHVHARRMSSLRFRAGRMPSRAATAVAIDADDIGGVVSGPTDPRRRLGDCRDARPPVRYIKIVADRRSGALCHPRSAESAILVWARGYGPRRHREDDERAREAGQPFTPQRRRATRMPRRTTPRSTGTRC